VPGGALHPAERPRGGPVTSPGAQIRALGPAAAGRPGTEG